MAKFQKKVVTQEAREVVRQPIEKAEQVVKPTGRENWVYVTIPTHDLLGDVHPGIGINLEHWGPGTHLVAPDKAQQISERLRVFDQATLRVLSPRKDLLSISQNRGSGGLTVD